MVFGRFREGRVEAKSKVSERTEQCDQIGQQPLTVLGDILIVLGYILIVLGNIFIVLATCCWPRVGPNIRFCSICKQCYQIGRFLTICVTFVRNFGLNWMTLV